MMQNRIVLWVLLLMVSHSCIKPYEPEFKDSSINKIVVDGMIVDEVGWQEIAISRSSDLNNVKFIPLKGCQVVIIDQLGNKKQMTDLENGSYGAYFEQDYLVVGRGYQIKITTPQNVQLESDFDYLTLVPDIITPTYKIETQTLQDGGAFFDGLQFYIDVVMNQFDSKFFQWELEETWEYHSKYPVEYYYDGQINQISPPDSSEFYCWSNTKVDEIFVLSTKNLSANEFVDFPLHFVANNTPRLGVLYSLKINQYSLSEAAYNYWDQMKQNQSNQGGLYMSQPIAIEGNIRNLSNTDEEVLGFFQVCSKKSQRIFVSPPNDLEMIFTDWCNPIPFERSLSEISPNAYPIYLETVEGFVTQNIMNEECMFCTNRGGTTEKPVFWP